MKTSTSPSESPPREIWSVVVVYEDLPTRERAMVACDHLVNQFWPEIEFKFHWWRTDFLEDDGMALTAGENAAQSDFVVYCGGPEKELSPKTRRWFETWVSDRNGRDVALLDLTPTGPGVNGHTQEKRTYLRAITQPTSIAYLTSGLVQRGRKASAAKHLTHRTLQISSVLDSVLHHAAGSAFASARI
jgi:hypothetical protein